MAESQPWGTSGDPVARVVLCREIFVSPGQFDSIEVGKHPNRGRRVLKASTITIRHMGVYVTLHPDTPQAKAEGATPLLIPWTNVESIAPAAPATPEKKS